MLPIHFLKRYFPNAPDWLLGGLFLICILWLIVLPIEILEVLMRHDFLRPGLLVWIVRSFYIFGYRISLFLISSLTNSSYIDITPWLAVVVLGLLISSPAYFVSGALLAIKKSVTIILGLLLLAITFYFGFFTTLAILFSD